MSFGVIFTDENCYLIYGYVNKGNSGKQDTLMVSMAIDEFTRIEQNIWVEQSIYRTTGI